jgi:surface protein
MWSLSTDVFNYDNVITAEGPSANWFYSTWNTSNTSTGSSTATQIKLPLVATGTYNFVVDWGDGTSPETITAWNQAETTHTYATAATYIIRITGTITGWQFNNGGDKLKLLSISQWGTLRPGNNTAIFMGCGNLRLDDVRGVLDTTGMTSFYRLFHSCTSLVQVNRINEWNTFNVTNMGSTFDSSYRFNDNIGNWNTFNVTTFELMFAHAGAFNNGGSPDIDNWNTANVTTMRFMFGTDGTVPGGTAMKFNQPIGTWDTTKVTNMSGMFARNNAFNQDISTKVVTKTVFEVTQNFTVKYGVTFSAWDTKNVTDMESMLSAAVVGNGQFNQYIGNWNTSKVTLMNSMFNEQTEFNQDVSTKVVTVGSDTYTAWDTKEVTNMSFIFSGTTAVGGLGKFNQNIGNWNTSKVTNMGRMFLQKNKFNQDISTKVVTVNGVSYTAWDTKEVTDMAFMLYTSSPDGTAYGEFNQNIGNWNTSKVTTLYATFYNQKSFNQNIGTKYTTVNGVSYTAWDTKEVTNMSFTCRVGSSIGGGVFNNGESNDIKDWNTSKVTTMQSMFSGQPLFNQNIGTKASTVGFTTWTAWDTLNVTNMSYMLNAYVATNTNGGVFNNGGSGTFGNWNTSKVTDMSYMLQDQVLFNQTMNTMLATINSVTYTAWDTLNVTNMAGLFAVFNKTGIFNQNLGSWNTSKVTNMNAMFIAQVLFDKNIGTREVTVGASTYTAWNTLNVTNMSFMFSANPLNSSSQGVFNNGGATALTSWNTSKVTTFQAMFQNQPLFNQNLRTKTVTVGASTYTAWDTLDATSMRYMFFNKTGNTASQFNQNIGNWNTAKVTDMTAMFCNAASFNQNIDNWNVSLVTAFNSPTALNETFADGTAISTANYDDILEGWSLRPVLANKVISFGTTKYSAAAVSERAILTSAPNNWTIVDGGLAA